MILWLLFTGAEFDILFSEHGAAVVVKPDREGEMSLASRLPSPFAHSIIYQFSSPMNSYHPAAILPASSFLANHLVKSHKTWYTYAKLKKRGQDYAGNTTGRRSGYQASQRGKRPPQAHGADTGQAFHGICDKRSKTSMKSDLNVRNRKS